MRYTLIGERINASIPAIDTLLKAGQIDRIVEIAQQQAEQGADYIDVNIGHRKPALMAELVQAIQRLVSVPLCIDSPDFDTQKAGLSVYDPHKCNGLRPIVNSMTVHRQDFIGLSRIQPVRFILLPLERIEQGKTRPNLTAEHIVQTALALLQAFKTANLQPLDDDTFIIDPGLLPLSVDTDGRLNLTLQTIKRIHRIADLERVHVSVGLSNLTNQLPGKTASGRPVKTPLESAFLTLASPLGLDTFIGNPAKQYQKLDQDHPAMRTMLDILELSGTERLMRLQRFYRE